MILMERINIDIAGILANTLVSDAIPTTCLIDTASYHLQSWERWGLIQFGILLIWLKVAEMIRMSIGPRNSLPAMLAILHWISQTSNLICRDESHTFDLCKCTCHLWPTIQALDVLAIL
jgi:hypothetical protein